MKSTTFSVARVSLKLDQFTYIKVPIIRIDLFISIISGLNTPQCTYRPSLRKGGLRYNFYVSPNQVGSLTRYILLKKFGKLKDTITFVIDTKQLDLSLPVRRCLFANQTSLGASSGCQCFI